MKSGLEQLIEWGTPKREGKCQKQIAVHFIRKAKEAK